MRETWRQDSLETLKELGLELPSPATCRGLVVFSLIGIVAYYYGKRHGRSRMRWLRLALMSTRTPSGRPGCACVVGAGLSVAAWLDRP
jgi:hypothetical protein